MTIKKMTFIAIGALLGGLIAGLIMKSIFGGIAFTILFVFFIIVWRYMKKEQGNIETEKVETPKEKIEEPVSTDSASTPPVSVGNIPQEKTEKPTYYQPPKEVN